MRGYRRNYGRSYGRSYGRHYGRCYYGYGRRSRRHSSGDEAILTFIAVIATFIMALPFIGLHLMWKKGEDQETKVLNKIGAGVFSVGLIVLLFMMMH